MNNSNNILQFPHERVRLPSNPAPSSMEEIEDKVGDFKKIHIQEAIEAIIPLLFNQIQILGFEPPEDDSVFVKDGAFIVEAIRSFMSKVYGISHPMQLIADSLFVENSEHGFVLSDRVKVVITPPENTIKE